MTKPNLQLPEDFITIGMSIDQLKAVLTGYNNTPNLEQDYNEQELKRLTKLADELRKYIDLIVQSKITIAIYPSEIDRILRKYGR